MLSNRNILATMMVFYGLMMISPVFPYFGISGTLLTGALFAALMVFSGAAELQLSKWFLFVALIIVILACVPAAYWSDPRYVLSTVYLLFSLYLLQSSDSKTMEWFLTLATGLMLILLTGAIVGFVLALNGVQPLFDIPNADGKPNHFFYTTLSRLKWGNVIRPAGFYDEPGAFSFMICAVAALRHLRGRDSRTTWLLLALGLVTLSLAHLVYVILHAVAERLNLRNVVRITAILMPIVIVAGYLGGGEIIEKRLVSRATVTEAGELVGDNRSWRMVNAAVHLTNHPQAIFVGADPSCRFAPNICKKKFPQMGENPLSPLAFQGIFISWPYYLALAVLFIAPFFGRKYIVSFAFGALLLQRPYMVGIGYSLVGLLVLATTIEMIVSERHTRNRLAAINNTVPA
jgi:hypothetical protein